MVSLRAASLALPKVKLSSVMRGLWRHAGDIFAFLLVCTFLTAGWVAWVYAWHPLAHPSVPSSSKNIKPPDPKKLPDLVDKLDARSEAYKKPSLPTPRNPFLGP